MKESHDKINSIINLLSEIHAKDLDNCSVETLTQFQDWLSKHQGAIFIKTVGRLAAIVERETERKTE